MTARKFLAHRKLERREIAEMKRLWRSVPYVHCKGLCQDHCTNVPLFPTEALYLIGKHAAVLQPAVLPGANGAGVTVPVLGLNEPCQFLRGGRCSIYDDRPSVCREFGHKVMTLDCGHDCKAKVPLTEVQALQLLADHLKLSNFEVRYDTDLVKALDQQVGQMVLEVECTEEEAEIIHGATLQNR